MLAWLIVYSHLSHPSFFDSWAISSKNQLLGCTGKGRQTGNRQILIVCLRILTDQVIRLEAISLESLRIEVSLPV
jgi:hypothetical protein